MTPTKLLPTLLCLALGLGCGTEGGSGIGSSSFGDRACPIVCASACSADIMGIPSDPGQCIDECVASGIADICNAEVTRFFRCLELNRCDPERCTASQIDFGQCFSLPPDS